MAPINQLTEGMQFEAVYGVSDMSLRETRSGKHYIRIVFSDATGSITGNMWDASEEIFQSLSGAKVVKVRASVESYRNALQLKVSAIRPADAEEVDASQLIAETPHDRDQLVSAFCDLLATVADADYSALLHAFFDDDAFLARFRDAPAAREFHHAYVGGLLEHTLSIIRACDDYCRAHPELRRDLLVTGAVLHDIGKLEEMEAGVTVEYTDEGFLVGHLVLGVLMIEERLRSLPDFPRVKRNLILHLLLSHHGQREYGSPVLPAVPEAFALHHIDNLDAKVFAARKAIDDDPDPGRSWTDRSFMLETRLYKG